MWNTTSILSTSVPATLRRTAPPTSVTVRAAVSAEATVSLNSVRGRVDPRSVPDKYPNKQIGIHRGR